MAACTDAERALIDAWMQGVPTQVFYERRRAVLMERVTDELRARVTQAFRDELRARRHKHKLLDELAGAIGQQGDDFASICDGIKRDAELLEGAE